MNKIAIFLFSVCLCFGLESRILPHVLQNGLKVYHAKPLNHSDFIFIDMGLDFGSVYESEDEQGLAHFLEHMSFNSTLSKSADEILGEFKNMGVKMGQNLNANTDFKRTNFKIQILNSEDNLDKALKFFSEILYNLAFLEHEIEKEKGIIINEASQRDDKEQQIFISRLKILFGDSIFSKRIPIGKMDIVKGANSQNLKNLYNKFYNPCRTTLTILGDVDGEILKNKIDKNFSHLKNRYGCEIKDAKVPFYGAKKSFLTKAREINFYFEMPKNARLNQSDFLNDVNANLLSKILTKIYYKNGLKNEIKFTPINVQNQKLLYNFRILSDFRGDLEEFISVLKMVKNDLPKSYFLEAKKELLGEVFKNYSKPPTPIDQMKKLTGAVENDDVILGYKDEFNLYIKLINNLFATRVYQKKLKIWIKFIFYGGLFWGGWKF